MRLAVLIVFLAGLALCALLWLRVRDARADRAAWARLAAMQPAVLQGFDPAMVADLPEPAQRYFRFAIAPGTPLLPVAEIDMGGQFSLGTRDAPGFRPMRGRQILAAPHGFVWRVRLPGWIPLSGSDAGSASTSWTRFRMLGLIPLARLGGDRDHLRAAFGRYVAEAVFWTPAALLPAPDVRWQATGPDTASVTLSLGELTQTVACTVDAEGRLVAVSFLRWSNANPQKRYREQAFGGTLSDFREVQGYRLPFRVEAGNQFGTDDYFAFYRAAVTAIRFPRPVRAR